MKRWLMALLAMLLLTGCGSDMDWERDGAAGSALTPLPAGPEGEIDVTGDAARALAEALPYRSHRLYNQGEAYYQVAVRPLLPRLF